MRPDPGPIRVMHVLHRIALGGTEYGVIKVANNLDPRLFAPSICSLRVASREATAELKPGVRLHDMLRQTVLDAGLFLDLWRLFRAERVDVVHSHNWSTYSFTVVAARLAGVPVIVHGLHGRDTEAPASGFVRTTAERILARATHHFTTVSSHLRDSVVRDWGVPPHRVLYVPNGVDLSRFGVSYSAAEIREGLGVGPEDRLIGTVGSIREVKGYDILVRSFEMLHRRMPGVKLLLVGLDPGGRFIEKLAREIPNWESVRRDILFLGVRRDIPEILSVLDVYVNSSLYEGMSNSILEAMASSKPVVATAVGGTPDLVEDGVTGWLVPPKDAPTLADKLERTLSDRTEAAQMGRRGRDRVERHHSFAGMVRANEALYRSLYLQAKRRPRPADQVKVGAARVLRASGILAMTEATVRPALTILCYHRILPMGEKADAPAQGMIDSKELFERQVETLARDYRVLTQAQVLEHCESKRPFPRRAVWINIDNGYGDNFEHAFPILRRYGVPATIFLVPEPLDTGAWLWWDDVAASLRELHGRIGDAAALPEAIYPEPVRDALRRMQSRPAFSASESDSFVRLLRGRSEAERRAIVSDLGTRAAATRTAPRPRLMLTWDEIREMSRSGITYGLHTVGPGTFDTATESEGLAELSRAIDRIAAETGERPLAYSYPIGPPADRIRPWLATCGIRLAVVSPSRGFNVADSDPLMLGSLSGGYLSVGETFSRSYMRMEMLGLRARLKGRR